MKMRPIDESRYDDWDRFVYKAGNGTIFQTAWWYRSWGIKFDIYASLNKDGEIEAGMPVYISRYEHIPKFLGVQGVTSAPLTPVNGPVFKDCAKIARSSKNGYVKEELLCCIESLPRADFYDLHLWRFCSDLTPFIWNGFETNVYHTYVIPAGDMDTWKNNTSSGNRRFLKKAYAEAEEEGYSKIETGLPFDEISIPFTETEEAKKYKERLFERMPKWLETVLERKAGTSYLIRDKEGRPACSSIMVWDNRTAYLLMNGTLKSMRRESHVNMLLYERMIEDALGMGLDFDFEGSTLRGVERFYRGWGGEIRPCFRVTKCPSLVTYIGLKGYRYLKFHKKKDWVSAEGGI
jgi:hypothetical protein